MPERTSRLVPLHMRAGVCVGAAIFHGDSLLLLRRIPTFPGLWELPGGSVEEGEKLEEALRREVQEETGLTVKVRRPFHASTLEVDGQEARRVTIVAIEFLCEISSRAAIQLSPSEHDGFAWVRRDEVNRYQLVPGFAEAIPESYRVHELSRGT